MKKIYACEEVLNLFKNFHIIAFHEELEYDEEVSKEWGADQYEHLYMVVARRKGKLPQGDRHPGI